MESTSAATGASESATSASWMLRAAGEHAEGLTETSSWRCRGASMLELPDALAPFEDDNAATDSACARIRASIASRDSSSCIGARFERDTTRV
eukprot:5832960-Pleurochrysis_carterae.AAC.2